MVIKKNLVSTFELVTIREEELHLLPEKAIYWEAQEKLLIADLHLGKATHFRNNGIAVPKLSEKKNTDLLHQLFKKVRPKVVCFLGDLFHSVHNAEWEVFSELIKSYPEINFELVIGNHDILDRQHYKKLGLTVFKEKKEPPFLFTHEPFEKESNLYNLAGHIHPGVHLRGKGNQRHRAACFYFGKHSGLLPAFGSFTGLYAISIKKEDKVYVVAGEEVIPV